jgi:pilus assembly protein FimV
VAFNKEKVMDAARKFVDKGQLDKAVKEYLRIVREDPRDVRVWLKIGDLYAKKGSKQEAVETYLRVAHFYHEQGFFLKAVAVYKQILKLDPRLVDVNLKLAELYRQLGLMSDAMQHFEAVAAHFHREGNTRDALAAVRKLVDLDPENIATRIKLAELYSKEGMTQDAVGAFAVACDQLRRQGRQDDFIKVAERLLFHQPDNHALNRELAALYLHRNDPRRALQKLQASFKADPRDVDTLALLASAFQALEQKSKTVSVLKELARIHQENKSLDKAADVFRRILELAPADADAIAFLGEQASKAPAPTAPAAVAAAASQPPERPRLQLTNEMPNLARQSTGSVPLLNDEEISAVDFQLPEYDDAEDGDFSEVLERSAAHDIRANSAGEQHAEEIAKTLAEADVYVKYNLHQKAIDHLRRVFSFDPHNVEARERLKEIFISQGRALEAEGELFALAEMLAPSSPDRAEGYLRELLAVNGAHTGAFELARRFRLRVARLASEPAIGGQDYNDFEYEDGADSVDNFDPNEIIGLGKHIAHGSPAPGRPPGRPSVSPNVSARVPASASLLTGAGGRSAMRPLQGDDFVESPSQETRQLSAEQASALLGRAQEELDYEFGLDDDPIAWDGTLPPDAETRGNFVGDLAPVSTKGSVASDDDDGFDASFDASLDASLDASVEAQLDDVGLGVEIDLEVANELAGEYHGAILPEDMPFDPHEAREFDATVGRQFDPYGEEQETPVESYDAQAGHSVDTAAVELPLEAGNIGLAERELEDELEEAEFYSSQRMFAQASEILRNLSARFPHHPLIAAKLRDVAAASRAPESLEPDALGLDELGGRTEAIRIDDLEELDDFDDLGAEPQSDEQPALRAEPRRNARAPSVMLEKPLDDGDADTHYDLGQAYKEMGLYHEAIKAFDKARRGSKEVQSRLMIGICNREMGNGTEAVHQFKLGLHADAISDRERQSLYYEIGATYEGMNDTNEALYYFEMVVKRDPGFADAANRAEVMRSALRRSG